MASRVLDIIDQHGWLWPNEWVTKYHAIANLPVPLLRHLPDRLVWRMDGVAHNFSVSIVWHAIRESGNIVDWCKLTWFAQAIPRHSFIVWLIMGGHLKTQDRLQPHEINPNVILLCPLCRQVMDTHEPLFFAFNFSTQIWIVVRGLAKMDTTPPSWVSITNHLKPHSHRNIVWIVIGKLVLGVVSFFIWHERNLRLFKWGSISVKSEARKAEVFRTGNRGSLNLKLM